MLVGFVVYIIIAEVEMKSYEVLIFYLFHIVLPEHTYFPALFVSKGDNCFKQSSVETSLNILFPGQNTASVSLMR